MKVRSFLWTGVLVLLLPAFVEAQNLKPVLRLEAGGPTSNVTSMAFSPDGNTLYAAGFDKVVRVWRLQPDPQNPKDKKFELDPATSYRVPIHPGTQGAINALALSSDGQWLAVGGLGIIRDGTSFHDSGILAPAVGGLKPEMREDQGVIYVFHTQKREIRTLRGHRGPILALAFAAVQENRPLLLASAARGYDAQGSKVVGEMRLWNVDKSEQVAEYLELPGPEDNVRPSLAVYSTGPQPKQAAVAVAWGDLHKGVQGYHGLLRIWDTDKNQVQAFEDGYENISLALFPDEKRLVTASFRLGKGRLQLWKLTGASATPERTIELPGNAPKEYFFPRHLSLFATQADGAIDYSAVILRRNRDGFVELIDVDGKFAARKVSLPLWSNLSMEPMVASSLRGRFLAFAGNPDHTIKVYSIADLLNDKNQPQVLQSIGTTFRFVQFVDKAGKPGLILSESMKRDDPRQIVFDFSQRQLASPKEWNLVGPKLENWKVGAEKKEEGWMLSVSQQEEKKGKAILLPAEQRLDSLALLPPQAPWNVPLVAVGFYIEKKGEVALDIYNAQTGLKIRRFNGHLAPIRSLAFSADGKLLASASEDQTVSVWTLTDLPEILGKAGGIEGLGVEKKGEALVISLLEPTSSAAPFLKKGQTIQGIVTDQKELKPLASAHAFYNLLWRTKPGQAITIRVQGEDVKLTVDQGIDVHKPLFSLFITRPDKAGKQEWLGWNAVGPFDSSQPQIEKFLGWHFNTGQAKEPTSFATMDQFGKEYFKKNILKHLVAQANLPGGLKAQNDEANPPPPAPPVPKIKAGIGAITAPNGDLIFHSRKDALQFAVHQFEPKKGDVVEWTLDNGPPQTLEAPDGNTWSIPLTALPDKTGRYKVRLTIHQRGPNQQTLTYSSPEVTVRFQQPPPSLAFEKEELQMVANQAEFPFKAKVLAATPGQKVNITITHQNQGKTVTTETTKASLEKNQPVDLKKDLNLQEGSNRIEVVAENVDALSGFEEEERARRTLEVQYNPKAPSILIQEVIPLARDGADESIPVQPGQPVKVSQAKVRIRGLIEAQENLLAPEWDLGPDTQRQKIPAKEFAQKVPFQIEVDLQPGEQRLRIFARTGQSKEVSDGLGIHYHPPLPRAVITSPAANTRIQNTEDQGEVILKAKLISPRNASPKPFKMKVHYAIDGKELPDVQEVDSMAETLPERKLPLKPGLNVFQVRLSSRWSADTNPAEVSVMYARPPRILGVNKEKVGAEPFVNLSAEVASPLAPLENQVFVEVNGKSARPAKKVQVTKSKDRLWTVTVPEIPLEVDENKDINENRITLQVANAEDKSAKSEVIPVTYNVPPPPKPEIVLETRVTTLKEPEYSFKFQVKARKLKNVEVLRGTQVLYQAADVNKLVTNKEGFYEFDTGDLTLDWGINELVVRAVNEGGPQSIPMVISVTAEPVRIDLDQIVVEEAKMETLTPTKDAQGKLIFPKASDGRVTLHGKIRWSSKDDAQLRKTHMVRVYVNGFQQLPAQLFPVEKGKRERKFEARLSLPWTENQVELLLPDLKKEANNTQEFSVACAKPVSGQQAHVVIIAPRETDQHDLKAKFRKAFAASKAGQDLFRAGIFDSVRLYAFPDYVTPGEVLTRLDNIASILKSRAVQGFPNDLVLVYYWGQQSEHLGENYFWTSETEPGAIPATSLQFRELSEKYFARFSGAQILLLDLYHDRPGTAAKNSWKDDYRFCLLGCMSETRPSFRYPLLGELEKTMPSAQWLQEVVAPLQKNLHALSFHGFVPPSLRVQLKAEELPTKVSSK
jgi:WD40 repeat protein